eukprot:TRINITY_DN65728_c0_g1_i1.p1 TRINITY_DN65728_c0_g1~~TRINITY_DN65728_c0_g1_i1.p1  ORF type:complete len:448 (+),score=93.01 TRINITY_DN65728_c0_g1_i1:93-1346(+)
MPPACTRPRALATLLVATSAAVAASRGGFLPGGMWWWLGGAGGGGLELSASVRQEGTPAPAGAARDAEPPPRGAATAAAAAPPAATGRPPGRRLRIAVLAVTAPAKYGTHGGVQYHWSWQGPMSTASKIVYAKRHGYSIRIGGHEMLDDFPMPVPRRQFVNKRQFRWQPTGEHRGRSPHWAKVKMVARWLADFDWVFWVDSDVIIMDLSRTVESMLPADPEKHIVWAAEPQLDPMIGAPVGKFAGYVIPNAGIFIVQNTEWSHEYMKEAWHCPGNKNHGWGDQVGFIWTLRGDNPRHVEHKKHVEFVPSRKINSRPKLCMRGWDPVMRVKQSGLSEETFERLMLDVGWEPGDWLLHSNRATCREGANFPGMMDCQKCWETYWDLMLKYNNMTDADFPRPSLEAIKNYTWDPPDYHRL